MEVKLSYFIQAILLAAAPIVLGAIWYFLMKTPPIVLNRQRAAQSASLFKLIRYWPYIDIGLSFILIAYCVILFSYGYVALYIQDQAAGILGTPTYLAGSIFGMFMTINMVTVGYFSYETLKSIANFKQSKSQIDQELQDLKSQEKPA